MSGLVLPGGLPDCTVPQNSLSHIGRRENGRDEIPHESLILLLRVTSVIHDGGMRTLVVCSSCSSWHSADPGFPL